MVKARAFTADEATAIIGRLPADQDVFFDREMICELLPKILTPEVDRHILSYFQSEYAPIAANFYLDSSETKLCESDGWHCDGGPSRHLVMMVYLTATEADGARTLFGDRKMTDFMKQLGYVYCELRQRQYNLDPLTDALTLPRLQPFSYDLEPGELILFDAPNVLHKRLLPTTGTRILLALAFVPSVFPWRQIVALGDLPKSITSEETTYPPISGLAQR